MAGVVNNYKTAYEEQGHVVEKIRLGLPVEHNLKSKNFVCWRYLELDLEVQPWSEMGSFWKRRRSSSNIHSPNEEAACESGVIPS